MTKQKNIRFTENEIAAIDRSAGLIGVSFADYVRASVSDRLDRSKTDHIIEKHKKEIDALHFEFRRTVAEMRLQTLADSKIALEQMKLEFKEQHDQNRELLVKYLKALSAQVNEIFSGDEPVQNNPAGMSGMQQPYVDADGNIKYK